MCQQARQQARQLEEQVAALPEPQKPRKPVPEQEKLAGPLQIGDTVRVLSFGQNAELLGLSADRSEAEVQMGALRFRVSVDNIERISKRKAASIMNGTSEYYSAQTGRASIGRDAAGYSWLARRRCTRGAGYLSQ